MTDAAAPQAPEPPPRGLRRCRSCGAVGADWTRLPTPAVAVFAAISAVPMVAIGYFLFGPPSAARVAGILVLGVAGAAVYRWFQHHIGEPACRYCGGQRFEPARFACPRHGEVEYRANRGRTWKLVLVVPFLLLAFAFAGTKDPEVAHLSAPAAVTALLTAGFVLRKTRRPGVSCGCADAAPRWTARSEPPARAAPDPR